jgi:O-antigen/teichoic acid export membrane protein
MESGTVIEAQPAAPATATATEPASRIGRNVAALAGGQLVTWTMTLGWTLVVPRLLGPAGMGLIVAAWSVTGILGVVLGLGTRNYLVRALVVDRAETPRLVGTAIALRVLLSPVFVAAVVVYAQLAHYGHEGTLVLYLAAGAMIFTLLAEPMQAAFQAMERMEYLAYSDVLNKSAQSLFGILLALAGVRAAGMMGCWMVVAGVVIVLDVLWLRRWSPIDLRTSPAGLAHMTRESLAYWAFGLFFLIYLWIDSVMLSLLTSPEVVGWYGVPMKLFQTLMFLPVVVSTAWLPRLVDAFRRGPARLAQEARRPVELVLVLALPLSAAVAVAAAPGIRLLYGPAYAEAVPVMVILGLCLPPMYLNIMLSQVLVAAGRQIAWTWVMAGATVVNPLLNAALIPATQARFGNGATGAAVSLLLTELLIVGVGFALAGRDVLGRAAARRGALAAVAAGAMCAVAFASRPLLGDLASALAGALTFVALAAALRLATAEEIAFARARLRRLTGRTPA